MNNNLRPEVRVNKNGIPVLKHVRNDDSSSNNGASIPAPAPSSPVASPASAPVVVRSGSLLSKEDGATKSLIEDYVAPKDGSASLTADDLKAMQRLLNTAVIEDGRASEEYGVSGNGSYFIAVMASTGDVNAIRTIYGRAATDGVFTVENGWNALRTLRDFEICDKSTNYARDLRFHSVCDFMDSLGLSNGMERGSEHEFIEDYEDDDEAKEDLLRYVWDNYEKHEAILDIAVKRQTIDIELIDDIMKHETQALRDGLI